MKTVQLLFTFICSASLFAQEYTHYTVTEGLINNSVNCVTIDDNQNIWFGTNNGVSKFDGVNWESFTTDMSPDLVDNSITAICATSAGEIWLGSDFGVSVFDGSTWVTYVEEDGLGDDRVSYISEDVDGVIWIAEKNGLSRFDGSSWITYGTEEGLPFGGLNYVTFDSNNELWLANSIFGLIHFDGLNFTTYNTNSGLISNTVRAIAIDENDNKWVGTAQGISVLNAANELEENHTMMLLLPEPDTLNPVVDIALDSQGNVWAGVYVDYLVTVGGVAAWNSDTWTGFTYDSELVGPVVRALAVDANDAIWVATSTGVTKITNPQLSISQLQNSILLSVYPNPASSSFVVRSENQIESYKIFNLLGKTMKESNTVNLSEIHINSESLSSGLYIIDVVTSTGRVREFVVIE